MISPTPLKHRRWSMNKEQAGILMHAATDPTVSPIFIIHILLFIHTTGQWLWKENIHNMKHDSLNHDWFISISNWEQHTLKQSIKTLNTVLGVLNTDTGLNESASLHQIKNLLRIYISKLLPSPSRFFYEKQLSAEPDTVLSDLDDVYILL